jgi:hypothetical protein
MMKYQQSTLRRGFSFTEVMFAVILLGLGFIMVAAIFPVAIRQSQANLEDTAGVAVAKSAGAVVAQQGLFSSGAGELPVTQAAPGAPVMVFWLDPTDATHGPAFLASYRKMMGNVVNQADPRFGFAPIGYRRAWLRVGVPSPTAEIFVVATQARNRPIYDNKDVTGFTFIAKPVSFYLTEGDDVVNKTTGTDLLTFTNGPTSFVGIDVPAAGEGTYVLVGNDQVAAAVGGLGTGYMLVNPGQANGRYYRLGAKRDDLGPGVWELASGGDMIASLNRGPNGKDESASGGGDDLEQNENLPPRKFGVAASAAPGGKSATGFIIGRGYADPGSQQPFSAPVQIEGNVQDLFMIPPVAITMGP